MRDGKFEVIDTHTHLDFKNFNKDRDEVIRRALDAGVTTIINSGIDFKTNRKTLELAKKYDFIRPTLGLNPNGLGETTDVEVQATLDQIRAHAREIVGVGEAGLDYYRCADEKGRNRQREVFGKVVALAEELDLPQVIHARIAEDEAFDMVKDLKKVVFHCYSGTVGTMRDALDRGFYISLATVVCKSAQHQVLARQVPLDRLLIETDSPFLSPRSGRNEPAYVLDALHLIARIKGLPVEDVASATAANAKKIFNL
ncbi:TatD family hydrolase [Candidatus Methanocrinis natronophilus]|uniref:TatD family hydrolase n=1 Tax=Candidatus Methanocrinis natronophilus TaxID=3033396 RepID=A0ABT5X7P7_9EURY|nr:TatD family hydrolase [Candidatus Methanocrinis natronophilus]MDF0590722.1 TatD family hydrolase [Candidatus Methanocrinis natronophilus]